MTKLTGSLGARNEINVDIIGTGPRGKEGKSAYEIWLDLGNTGTEQDFIDSIGGGDGSGDMLASVYDPQGKNTDIFNYVDEGLSGKANASHEHTVDEITDFPTTMPPSAHEHTTDDITDFPTSMTPTAHNHAQADVTGLSDALAGKVDKVTGKGLSTEDYTTTEKNKLAGIEAGANNYTHPATHSISEVSGLQDALDGKVDNSRVLTDVPANAKFTDTVYTHPESHAGTMITIADAGGYFTGTTIEAALQEIGATLDGLDAALEALL